LDKVTYPNTKVVGLASKFIPVKLDVGNAPAAKAADKHKVEATPTILFLNSKGKEIGRYVGFIAPDEFAKMMGEMLKKAKS
jgi:thioredoxin-related protein